MSKARLQIRQKNYRGRDGFLITGTDVYGRRASIFTYTRESADQIKNQLTAGTKITSADFAL